MWRTRSLEGWRLAHLITSRCGQRFYRVSYVLIRPTNNTDVLTLRYIHPVLRFWKIGLCYCYLYQIQSRWVWSFLQKCVVMRLLIQLFWPWFSFADWATYKDRLLLRSQQVANSPELIRRLGIIAMNTPLEVDIVRRHLFWVDDTWSILSSMGMPIQPMHWDLGESRPLVVLVHCLNWPCYRMLNGLGGSADFLRSAKISIMHTPSTCVVFFMIWVALMIIVFLQSTQQEWPYGNQLYCAILFACWSDWWVHSHLYIGTMGFQRMHRTWSGCDRHWTRTSRRPRSFSSPACKGYNR